MTATDLQHRIAIPDDHYWIVRSVDAWWGRSVAHAVPRLFLDHFHRTSFVMEDEGRPVGFLIGLLSPSMDDTAYIHFVGVHPDYRGRGIARRLYELFFELASRNQRTCIKAITAPVNTDSIAFHRSMGFSVSEPVPDYDRPGVAHVTFVRDGGARRPEDGAAVSRNRMPRVEVTGEEQPAVLRRLDEELHVFNTAATGLRDWQYLLVVVRDEAGDVAGGVSGHTWGGSCEIDRVWLSESLRGKGEGAALMRAAEDEAARRGCTQMVLSTYSFQAPGFYERLGFEKMAAVAGHPRGHSAIYYVKKLRSAQDWPG